MDKKKRKVKYVVTLNYCENHEFEKAKEALKFVQKHTNNQRDFSPFVSHIDIIEE